MSFAKAMSLVVVAALIVVLVLLLTFEFREAYRAVRTTGAPRFVAIPVAVVLALLSGC